MDDEFRQQTYINDTTVKPPKRKLPKRLIVFIVIFVVATVCLVFAVKAIKERLDRPSGKETTQASETHKNGEQQKKRIRFIATGDMIPHDAINATAKQADGSYEYSPMFGDMKELFDNSDIRFCNQAVLGGGTQFGITGYPEFNSPTEFARDMAELGCNVINTGSNHTNDFSQTVVDASVSAWDHLPNLLAVAGANRSEAEKQKVHYFEIKGVKFAFVSYTTYSNKPSPNGYGVTMYSQELAQKQLAEARSQADVVIASMRWGTEYSPAINAQQRAQARTVANLGADIVIGHGPHVLEPTERITTDDGRETIVWYSLGNFLNAQLEAESLFNGIAVMDIDPETKKVTSTDYLPVYMHYEWTQQQKAQEDLLSRKNFKLYTFDDAVEPLSRSQNNTTLEEQRARIEATLNKLTTIKLISKDEFLQS